MEWKGQTFLDHAVQLVFDYVKAGLEKTDTHVTFSHDEVYIVWFSKTLQNWKALLSTTLPDGMYYEVTFDGNKNVAYIDAYKKWDNVTVSLGKGAVEDVEVRSLSINDSPSGVDAKSQYVEPRNY